MTSQTEGLRFATMDADGEGTMPSVEVFATSRSERECGRHGLCIAMNALQVNRHAEL